MKANLHDMKHGGANFKWSNAGVHTVRSNLSPEPVSMMIPKMKKLTDRVMGGGYFNDALFKTEYVLFP